MSNHYDVIIVGSGVAGCFNAIHLPKTYRILLITKDNLTKSNSFLAQGGICVLKDASDRESFIYDTLHAGQYENNREAVETMVDASNCIIKDLESIGVIFNKRNHDYVYTKEGAHTKPRILYHKDITGKEIASKLLAKIQKQDNIKIVENTKVIDLLVHRNQCYGVVCTIGNKTEYLYATYTVLATGGIGGLFSHSTNYSHIQGDALTIAMKQKISVSHLEYIQYHPTTLYSVTTGRRFLISEAVRGEGAVLYNKKKERFVNELLPRDILTEAIYQQMKKDQQPFVWLSMKSILGIDIQKRFPNIVKHCKQQGIDPMYEDIPVVPAQHYFMGGIDTDLQGKTSMKNVYAIGETACNGVHGKNRLASNSLLECLVFSKRAARDIYQNDSYFDKQYAQISKEKYQCIQFAELQKQVIEKMKVKV